MDEFVFAGLVMFAVTLLAMGVMDVLAVIITTLSKALRHHTGGARGPLTRRQEIVSFTARFGRPLRFLIRPTMAVTTAMQ
jgi:hypothetical protein